MPQAFVTCAGVGPSNPAIFSNAAGLSRQNAIFCASSSAGGAVFGLLGRQAGKVPPDIYF
jgi:hypothetical protein